MFQILTYKIVLTLLLTLALLLFNNDLFYSYALKFLNNKGTGNSIFENNYIYIYYLQENMNII